MSLSLADVVTGDTDLVPLAFPLAKPMHGLSFELELCFNGNACA